MRTNPTMIPCPSQSGPGETANRTTTQFSRHARHKTAILAGGLLASATLAAHATTFATGFEAGQGYTGGTATGANQLVPQNGWEQQFGAPNFDVYTYAGNQVAYTPNAAVPGIGGIPQLVTFPQNPTGGSQFVAAGNGNGRDMVPADFTPDGAGLVEISVDYHPGDWFDNNGGNLNGALTLRGTAGNQGGFFTARGSAQPPGDANGNGPWAPSWLFWDAADVAIPTTPGLQAGYRFDGVTGFDNLARQWTRVGMVYEKATGRITQLKTQELVVGGASHFFNNPQVGGQDLYIDGGANPLVSTHIGIFNVGNGTLSAYDNLYAGPVIPEPSAVGLLLAGLSGLVLARRRK